MYLWVLTFCVLLEYTMTMYGMTVGTFISVFASNKEMNFIP